MSGMIDQIFDLSEVPGFRFNVKVAIAHAEVQASRLDVVRITRERMARELAERILREPGVFTSQCVEESETFNFDADVIVLSPDDLRQALTDAYRKGVMSRNTWGVTWMKSHIKHVMPTDQLTLAYRDQSANHEEFLRADINEHMSPHFHSFGRLHHWRTFRACNLQLHH